MGTPRRSETTPIVRTLLPSLKTTPIMGKIKIPTCSWIPERHGGGSSGDGNQSPELPAITTALMVFPNPASNLLTISYDYGAGTSNNRTLEVYDMMGRKLDTHVASDVHGSWSLDVANWAPGTYIIRMQGDGSSLQTQRVIITH